MAAPRGAIKSEIRISKSEKRQKPPLPFGFRISDFGFRSDSMAHLFQVGAGSGGMPVLDLLCGDPRINRVTLVEPDVYKPHNVERHLFPYSVVGLLKGELAKEWLKERCPQVQVDLLICDLLDPQKQGAIQAAVASCDVGVC